MSFTMPEFPEPTPIDGTRSWTATFDSYDQRHDVSYYLVGIHADGAPTTQLMAEVFMSPAGDDWTTPSFLPYLRGELHQVATAGVSNTEYRGYNR